MAIFDFFLKNKKKPKKKIRKKGRERKRQVSVKKKSLKARKPIKKISKEEAIGKITHYFSKIKVGVVKITKGYLNTNDTIHIKGHTTDFKQKVSSMQIEHKAVKKAAKGKEAGIKVIRRVRGGDLVFKLKK